MIYLTSRTQYFFIDFRSANTKLFLCQSQIYYFSNDNLVGDSIIAGNVGKNASMGHVLEQRTGRALTIRAESGGYFASVEDEENIRSNTKKAIGAGSSFPSVMNSPNIGQVA